MYLSHVVCVQIILFILLIWNLVARHLTGLFSMPTIDQPHEEQACCTWDLHWKKLHVRVHGAANEDESRVEAGEAWYRGQPHRMPKVTHLM